LYASSNQLGWLTQLLPYFEQDNIQKQYNFNEPWFDASNANIVIQRIRILECPSSPSPRVYTATDPDFAGIGTNPLTTFTVASTDHSPFPGAPSPTTEKAPSTIARGYFSVYPSAPSTTDRGGAFGLQMSAPPPRRLVEIPDGLPNTAMTSEMSGRPWLY